MWSGYRRRHTASPVVALTGPRGEGLLLLQINVGVPCAVAANRVAGRRVTPDAGQAQGSWCECVVEPPRPRGRRGAPQREASLLAAVVIRWGRRLVSGTAVIAAGASSRVRSCEWHPDTKDDAGERTRNELARAELPQSAHLLSRPHLRGYAEIRNTAGEITPFRMIRIRSAPVPAGCRGPARYRA